METIKLYELAERKGIKVDRFPLPQTGSVCLKLDSGMFIALDEKATTHAEERVRLAHELGHCETLAFYNVYSGAEIRGKSETKAEKWAIKTLIPEDKYIEALEQGYTDINSLAEYFDVTEEFMVKVAQFYCERVSQNVVVNKN